jgi:hypothetical protein
LVIANNLSTDKSHSFEGTTDKIKAFKPGHRMVIGNSNLRTPPATGGRAILDNADGVPQPIQWTCPRSGPTQPLYPPDSDGLHGVGIQDPHNKGTGVGFPDKNCDGYASPLRADIHFPSCWNPAEGLTNYKTNMAWPTKGNCPAGYVHVPHLFYEVYWNTPKFASRWTPGQGTQPFVLSNGDPTGYGLHGDFLSGWDEATLQQMIDNCDAGDSGMDKCPGLIGGVNDPSTSCNIKSSVSETVSGVLSALPGNNPIGKWGVDSVPKVMLPASSASSAKPSATTSTTNTRAVAGIINTETASKESATSSAASSVTTSYKTTTTSVTKTVSATTGLSLPSASSSPLPQGWTYYGCYSDNSNRVLSGVKFVTVKSGIINNTNCAGACDSRGFSMAGTEYGGQCFCGNSLNGSTKLDESKCNMPCKNSTQVCGGSYALSVYYKNSAKRSTSKRERSHMHNRMVRIAHKG